MSDLSNAERFITIYNEIDHKLRLMLHEEVWVSYHELVERAARFNRVVREYEENLKLIGSLRNVVVHRSTNQIIAEPAPFIINLADRIKEMLNAPPKVIPKFQKKVFIAEGTDSIKKVARMMKQNNFTRVPIYNDNNFLFLSTAGTIVRFIAENVDANLNEISISEVMPFMEHKDNFRFISKSTDIFKLAETFEIYHKNGKKMDAVLITETGSKSEKPIGMVTLFDVGEIYRQMEIRVND